MRMLAAAYDTADKKDFYEFTRDDVKLIDYETGPQIENIPVAI